MVGRDIGTVVLVEADIKLFLEASPEERAKRRQAEQAGSDDSWSLHRVRENLATRDHQDTYRAASPLKPADDAYTIVTDGFSIEQVIDQIMNLTAARG